MPRRGNKKSGLRRVEIAHAQKNKWEDDWVQYWFYAMIGFSHPDEPGKIFYPLALGILPFDHTNQPGFNKNLPGFKSYMSAFEVAGQVCGGRDLIEEYLAARVWPLSPGWFPVETRSGKFDCLPYAITCPVFGLKRPEGKSDGIIVAELEREALNILGPWNRKEYDFFVAVCCHQSHINRCLHEMGVSYEARPIPPSPQKRSPGPGNVGSDVPASKKSKGKAAVESSGALVADPKVKASKKLVAKLSTSQVGGAKKEDGA